MMSSTSLLVAFSLLISLVLGHNFQSFDVAKMDLDPRIEEVTRPAHLEDWEVGASYHQKYAINVIHFGAVGDSKTDNYKAFKNALNNASATHTPIVYVPPGRYLFKDEGIKIPDFVSLVGSYVNVPYHAESLSSQVDWSSLKTGSVLGFTTSNDPSKADPFIRLGESSSIRGFSIFYPDQPCKVTNNPGKVPIPYPAAIQVRGIQGYVGDIELINPYIGVELSSSSNNARHFIERVHGGPIAVGVSIDSSGDVGRIENTHFKSDWACPHDDSKSSTQYFTATQGVSYLVGKADWEFFLNTFSIGYSIAYHFINTTDCPLGQMVGAACDSSVYYSVKVDCVKHGGFAIVNSNFVVKGNDRFGITDNPAVSVYVGPKNPGAVHISNTVFWGSPKQILNSHAHASVSIENSEMHSYDKDIPVVQSSAGTVRLMNNNFYLTARTHLYFKKGTDKAILVGNSFACDEKHLTIEADSGVQLAQTANLYSK